MGTDWGKVWQRALCAAEDAVAAAAPAARRRVRPILQAREPHLRSLLFAWADHALDEPTLEHELDEERDVYCAELQAVQGVDAPAAQAAASAALRAIRGALRTGIDLAVPARE
jgi:hypothetical protein